MDASEFAKEMSRLGFQTAIESGVVMLTGDKPIEKMEKEIREKKTALGYNGSWGVRGYPKNFKGDKPVADGEIEYEQMSLFGGNL